MLGRILFHNQVPGRSHDHAQEYELNKARLGETS